MSGIKIYPKFDATKSKHYQPVVATGHFKNDDAGSIFATKQLTYLETTVLQKIEPDLTYSQVFPVALKGAEGDTTVEYRVGEGTGSATQIGSDGKFNRVAYKEKPVRMPIRDYGLEYGVSIKEIQAARTANRNLDTELVNQTNRGMEQAVNTCIYKGDGELPGMFHKFYEGKLNYYDATKLTTSTTVSGSKKLRDKTFTQVAKDISDMKAQVNEQYNGRFPVDTILLEPLDYEHILSLMSDYNMMMVDYLNKIGIKNIISVPELTSCYGSKSAVVLLPKDPVVIQAIFTSPKKALPVFFNGWEYVTKWMMSTGGLHIFHPKKILVVKYDN